MAVTYLSGKRIQGLGASPSTLSPIIDGSYTILKYTEDGAFTPTGTYDIEYLVVGGGGGASATDAGGGGGGAFRTDTGHEVTAQAYAITVGAGGTAGSGSWYGVDGGKGGNSILDTIQSDGGGGGAALGHDGGSSTGSTGGSGGGSAGEGYVGKSGGAGGTYGNNGGTAGGSSPWGGSGGGGSSGVGQDGQSNSQGGYGGSGTNSDITGSTVGYSGGGGGSSDGSGGTASHGGGAGMATDNSGTPNTGGGGGAGGSGDSKVGGSGIVVLKFLTSGNGYSATMGSVADKASVTDVPIGSEFEQTDDYKNYQFDGTNWVERGTAI